ncbi:MAG: dUTP diphosphatase [Candidatus Kerfeldbacteria bacterium]|nr:dUTP diphosphatase [Candidatus Kerfeldbacteria bacterium]
MEVQVKRLSPAAVVPRKAHGEEDAAFDLHSVEAGTIPPGGRQAFGTGVAFALPAGTVGMVKDRSGLALNHGITTLAGVVDAGYRGEVRVVLHNTGDEPFEVKPGDRIAQFLIIKHEVVRLVEAAELSPSARGGTGFGASGT